MSGTAGAAPAAPAVRAATGVSLDISQILRLQQGSGRAVSLERCAAPRCNAASLGASPLPARGARPLLRDPPSWPGRGQARTGRSRRLGWRPRSGGSCLPPPRTCECQTVPGPGPPRCCASQAPRPPRARAVARPLPGCPGRADQVRAGKGCICPRARISAIRPSQAFRRNGNPCRLKILLTYVQIPPSSPASAGQGPASLELAPEAGIVLPHEDVSPGPVAGRLALMEATQANLEPIFLLYDGRGGYGATADVVAETAAREPLISARTPDGLRHRVWAINDADDLD